MHLDLVNGFIATVVGVPSPGVKPSLDSDTHVSLIGTHQKHTMAGRRREKYLCSTVSCVSVPLSAATRLPRGGNRFRSETNFFVFSNTTLLKKWM